MLNPLISLFIGAMIAALCLIIFWPERGLYWRSLRVNQRTERVLAEDALKHIQEYEFQGKQPTIRSLAGSLNINTNQAVEVINRLHSLNFVKMKGDDFFLTETGRMYALQVIRAHRIYERYLADKTGYKESEWHTRANLIEHHLSPGEVKAMSQELGNPSYDPHGTPIPTSDGKIVFHKNAVPLNQLELGSLAQIVHIEDEPEAVYAQLAAEGLHLGQNIRLIEVSPQRLQLWTDEGEHILAPLLAANIDVVPVKEKDKVNDLPGQPLTNIKPGQFAQVIGLSYKIRGEERRRLMDLGLLPGTTIGVEMESASGNPIAYRIRGAVIALRKNQAELIRVCADESKC